MKLKEIALKDFRNYKSLSLSFHDKLNVFIGQNAQGKTNLLEAIYFLSLSKSHRTPRDKELIRFDSEEAYVSGRIETLHSTIPLSLAITKKGKRAKVNHLEMSKLSEYIGHLNCVLFAPEDLEIVKGAPQVRRTFIDIECGQISKVYLAHLSNYKRLLQQKNQYLKKRNVDSVMISVLNEQLATEAAEIILKRESFIKTLSKYAKRIHSDISNGIETLTVNYHPNIKYDDDNKDSLRAFILDEYNEVFEKEIERGQSVIGPHRDDIKFLINGYDVQTFGSQGQQRSTALSLKLAELDVIKEEIGEYPILLLDDVLSELDESRQAHLLTSIRDRVQTFVTTTSISDINHQIMNDMIAFTVENGTVKL